MLMYGRIGALLFPLTAARNTLSARKNIGKSLATHAYRIAGTLCVALDARRAHHVLAVLLTLTLQATSLLMTPNDLFPSIPRWSTQPKLGAVIAAVAQSRSRDGHR